MALNKVAILTPVDLEQKTGLVFKTLEVDLDTLVERLNVSGAIPSLAALGDYADDTAAAAGGVPIGGAYRTGSAIKIRVS